MKELDIFIKSLEKYIDTSNRKDLLPKTVRLAELEPSSIKYLETIINIANSREIARIEKIMVELDARINCIESPLFLENRIGGAVLKMFVIVAGIIGGVAAIVALIVSILK